MRLGINEITKGIYISAVEKVTRQLQREGFKVFPKFPVRGENSIRFDLYAEKGLDKRVYEFKIGRNKIRQEQFIFLQNHAKEIGARLFIIYLEIPISKKIQFRGIEDIIIRDWESKTPKDFLEFAYHIDIVDIVDMNINSIDIDGDEIIILGEAAVLGEAQMRAIDDFIEKFDFNFTFRLRLDHCRKRILSSYYKIDTSGY